MNLKKFRKETKHMLAFVLLAAMFFNRWANDDFSVLAAESGVFTIVPKTLTDDTVSYANDINASVTVSGNTLDGDVYTGIVTVTPAQGYTICASETGDYAGSLTYEETFDKPADLYLKDSNGNISKAAFPSFTFDNTPPVISVVAPTEEWAKSKEIEVTAEGADYGVFYTKGTKRELTDLVNKDTDLSGLTKLEGNLTIAENISSATTYYFYAIDKAGHVAAAEAAINYVDADKPTISVDETMKNFDEVNKVYWKSTADIVIPITVKDSLSGFDRGSIAIESTDDTGVLDLTFSADCLSVTGTVTIKQSGTYKITAIDKAGLSADEQVIVIKTDTAAPEVQPSVPRENGRYFDEDKQVYWFSDAKADVDLTVTDVLGNGENEKAPYTLIYSTDSNFATFAEADVTGEAADTDIGSASITLESSGTVITYYFKAVDAAGNENVQSIKLALDDSAPQITSASLTQLNGDAWINAAEFNGESKVSFSVTAEDGESGIQKIEYSSDNGQNYTEASFKEENGAYTFSANEEYPDGTGYQWKVRVTDNVGWSKEKEIADGKIDTTPPDTTAYIKFSSDTAGTNDTNRGSISADDKWTSKIWKMASEDWNKIWGKTTIKFEVYVQDVTSGVKSIEMKYHGTSLTAEPVDGLKIFTEGDENAGAPGIGEIGYTIFEGEITYTGEDSLAIQNFQIDSLTDFAGNTAAGPVILGNVADTDMIYLDKAAPKLSVEITDAQGSNSETDIFTNNRYFYTQSKIVTLTIEERFFGEEDNPVYPEVIVSSKTTGGQNITDKFVKDENLSTAIWNKTDGAYQWQAVIELPWENGVEKEYQINLEAYADPSGNILVGADGVQGVTKEGAFESKIFVVDGIAPELTGYHINKPTKCTVDGNAVYKNDIANDDLTVTFTIDDNEIYYETSKDNLVAKVYMDETDTPVLTLTDSSLTKTFHGRNHEYSFAFDGGTNSENEFYIEITYQDAAENFMADERGEPAEGINPGSLENGVYTSDRYVIDHKAPAFDITYSAATRIVKDGADGEGQTPAADYTAYYNKDLRVTCTFDEKYVNIKEDGSLDHFEFQITKDGKELTGASAPEVTWTQPKANSDSNIHTMEFKIPADKDHSNDGNYQFVIKYRDCAENAMIARKDAKGNLINEALEGLMSVENEITGVYTSPVLVMDTTAPIVITQYVNGEASVIPNQTAFGIDYFNDLNTVLKITVEDRNIRRGELKKVLNSMEACDFNANPIDSILKTTIDNIIDTDVQCVAGRIDSDENIWTLNLPLQTEANYKIPVNFTDLAGNAAQVNGDIGTFTELVTVDAERPELILSYSVADPANYLKWGYLFAKGQLNITVTAKDEVSGVQRIQFTVYDENGKQIGKTRKKEFASTGTAEYSIDIPLSAKDFKGSVLAEVSDYSANTTNRTRGHIIESAEKHSATGKAVIQTITSPSRSVGGVNFYNTDVKFKLTLEDSYSGLASWKYAGGNTLKNEYSYKNAAGTDLKNKPTKEITYSYVEELTLSASGNNKNDVLVTASYVDNAGYENAVEQKYNIDITKPEIEVTYDLNEPSNGKYYKETRTAIVRIRERNFDPSDVEFLITSTDGSMPQISDWSSSGSGDDTWHTCTLAFALDSDYTFTLKFQDMAGNAADYDRVDEFTIDKTIPVATITYDNNNFLNEYYYDAARTATIDILEHNFDPSAIEIMITADGGTAGIPPVSAWVSNGDHNIATVTFSADAEYTFDIAGLDLALNELEDYTPDHFVIDRTPPELEIFDIEHLSANNGVVRPGIRYHDTNYDKDGTVILMTGYHNGVVEMSGARKLEANGLELKLDDFPYVQELDDIYTMHAEAYDLAGNSSEATVMFSVNRFGSVYTFDEKTDALIGDNGKYYTNKEQELVITETNVDTLEFKEITCNLNGKLTTLKEGQDYTVSLNGNEATWKQYTYTIKEDNFVEEGTYILTIYSEDRATNTSDNSSKGKKVEFVVDKTNPSILISGIENNGQYRAGSREITLDIEDNIRLSKAVIIIDGAETVYDAAQIYEADGKFVLNIGSANHWQEIEAVVSDAAGNKEISEQMRVLVTANMFVQYFMNKPLFYGSLGTLAAITAFLWWFLAGRKRKIFIKL